MGEIRDRLLAAKSEEDLKRIEEELVQEGKNPKTIAKVRNTLRKKGLLKFSSSKSNKLPELALPVAVGSKEIVLPETFLRGIRLQDGDYKDGFIDGMTTLLIAARYNQLLAATQAEIMKGQIEIFREARGEMADIALKAAEEAAGRVVSYLEHKKPDIATTPHPLEGVLARWMENLGNQIFGRIFGLIGGQPGTVSGPTSGPTLPPGWRKK